MSRRKRAWGSITPFRGKWRVRGPELPDGSRESLGIWPTKEEARDILAAAREQAAGEERGITLAGWGERWFRSRRALGARKELSRWRTHIASHSIATRFLRRLSRQDVVAWTNDLMRSEAQRRNGKGELVGLGRPISWQTAKHALKILQLALEGAADEGLIAANVARDVKLPREYEKPVPAEDAVEGDEGTWTWLTQKEIDALLSLRVPIHATDRVRNELERSLLIWQVAIYTGLRPGELWGLRWCDVRLTGDRPSIHVRRSYKGPPKTKRGNRVVSLLRPAREALKRWQGLCPGVGEALVFPAGYSRKTKTYNGCHAEAFDAGFAKWRRVAGITRPNVTPRSWRHTTASHLLQGTWTPRPLSLMEVRDVLGHASISVTQRYAHLCPESVRDAMRDRDSGVDSGHNADTAGKGRAKKRK